MLSSAHSRLRVIGFLEGVSYLVLLGIAMPLKYFADSPLAVRYVGMAHGILFIAYLLALIPVAIERRWKLKTIAAGVLASILPAGPFVFDAKVLNASAAAKAPARPPQRNSAEQETVSSK